MLHTVRRKVSYGCPLIVQLARIICVAGCHYWRQNQLTDSLTVVSALLCTVYGHHIGSQTSKPWRKYKKATKLLPKIRHLKYSDRPKTCKLPTLSIVHYFLIRPEFIQSGFKYVSSFCMHNVIRQTVPHIDNMWYSLPNDVMHAE